MPLNLVGGLSRPQEGADAEAVADEIEGFVSGLLRMVGIDSDPLAGREHILLSNLIDHAWAAGQDLDLPTLVTRVQDPPLRKLGVYDLEAFYPAADRTKLAMTLNGLLASRAFAAWAEGPDLDMDRLLRSAGGDRPACAIVTLAHLSDEERQFVVSLLLGRLITWMRRQPGTDRLRMLVYFDEVVGFVPPTAAPPAKKPILTLLKQARAFGVGLVLATQNPVDVDYKGLSNAGTWMIGRLQTQQDRARLLDGLSSAAGGVDVAAVGDTIGGLGKREFLMRSLGAAAPALFTTRWAMSYLRGPLTREQIATLMAGRRDALAADAAQAPAPASSAASEAAEDTVSALPPVADGVPVRWLDPAAPWAAQVGAVPGGTRLAPALVTRVALLYDDDKLDLRETEEWEAVVFPLGPTVDPAAAVAVDHDDRDLRSEPPAGASYVLTDAPLDRAAYFGGAEKAIVDHLYRSRIHQVLRNRELKLAARAGETADAFAARCVAAADQGADDARAALRDRYEARIARAQDAVGAARDRAIGTLVFTIIEAPDRGWTSTATIGGFTFAAGAAAVFVAWERRRLHPMMDVSLFRNLRFSAASGSIMVIFFALAGFVFLITQYFQFLKGYAPLSTGVRILPVATCIAIGSLVGVRLSVTIGNKAVVATGLLLVGVSFAWVSTASLATPYGEIVGQMVLAGLGMGFTTAPATEAIMGVVPKEKAGIGSAVNDATRELGATLGVAIIGSVYASLFASGIQDASGSLRAPAVDAASDSIGAALVVSDQLGAAGQELREVAQAAFFDGFRIGCLVAAGVLFAGAAFAARFLPSRPTVVEPLAEPAPALETAGAAVAAGVPGCCWDREPAASPAAVG